MDNDFIKTYVKQFESETPKSHSSRDFYRKKIKQLQLKLHTNIQQSYNNNEFSAFTPNNVPEEIVRRCALPSSYLLYRKHKNFIPIQSKSISLSQRQKQKLTPKPKETQHYKTIEVRNKKKQTLPSIDLMNQIHNHEKYLDKRYSLIYDQYNWIQQSQFIDQTCDNIWLKAKQLEKIQMHQLQNEEIQKYKSIQDQQTRLVQVSKIEHDRLIKQEQLRRIQLKRDG